MYSRELPAVLGAQDRVVHPGLHADPLGDVPCLPIGGYNGSRHGTCAEWVSLFRESTKILRVRLPLIMADVAEILPDIYQLWSASCPVGAIVDGARGLLLETAVECGLSTMWQASRVSFKVVRTLSSKF